MERFLKFFLAGFLMILLFSYVAYAEDVDPMYDFYNGLSDIIERNMNSPDICVTQSETFIRKNIGSLIEVADKARQMAQMRPTTEKEAQRMAELGKYMPQAKGMEAMNRFIQVFGTFAMKHPEHAEKINEILGEYEPQFEGE